jgi:NAD(P)-dependent dehydrogenase (short-subunit alcohol dehydrogenase family)
MRLKDKLAIITGAASGMGRAGLELFAREGATVVAVDVDGDRLHAAVAETGSRYSRVHALVADLSKRDRMRSIIHEAAALLSGLDILWNNAGAAGPAEVEGLDDIAYDRSIELNLTSGILGSAEAVPYMRKRGGGSIVFTSSVSGVVGSQLSPTYSAAKFAVVGFAKSLSLRLAADNIRVNAICPGMTQTGMLTTFMDRNQDPETIERNTKAFIAGTPLGRIARPEEIAHAALWLASDDASFVTGAALSVDGGLSAK